MAHVPHHRRPRKGSQKRNSDGTKSFVAVKLYGKLAEKWVDTRGHRSDYEFVEYLLNLRTRFHFLKANCKCNDDSSDEESGEDLSFIADESHTTSQLCFGYTEDRNSEQKQIVNIEVEQGWNEESDLEEPQFDECNQKHLVAEYRRRCQMCKAIVVKGVNKKYHMLSEHFTLYVECKLCEKVQSGTAMEGRKSELVNMNDYTDHINSKHNAEEISCPYCRAKCLKNNSESLRKHIISKHSGNLFCKCKMCHDVDDNDMERGLIRGVSLKGHVRSKHMPDKSERVPCQLCGALIIQCNMAKHIKNVHEEKTENENNLCDLCGKHFVHLKSHKLSVHSKDMWMHKCETCGKSFAKRYNLEVHSRLHTGERPFICEVCGKGFCQKIELNSHRKNNHEKNRPRRGAKMNFRHNAATGMKVHPGGARSSSSDKQTDPQAVNNSADDILQKFAMDSTTVGEQPHMQSLPPVPTQDPVYTTLVGYPVAEDSVILTEVHMQGDNLPVLQNLPSTHDEKLRQDTTMNLGAVNWVQSEPGIPH